jgi:hypothetical protein
MAGGSLTLTTNTYAALTHIAQRVLCSVAAANVPTIQMRSGATAGTMSIYIPEESFGANLLLQRGGTNLLAGYVAGMHISFNAGNATTIGQDVNTCPASTNQPVVSAVTTNIGGNPASMSITYANVAASGLVNIYWYDGTSTLGAAESGTAAHVYPFPGVYNIRIEDATNPADFAVTTVKIP